MLLPLLDLSGISPHSPPREFRFTSEVPIWLDYHGKHVTMDQVVSGLSGPSPAVALGGQGGQAVPAAVSL